MPIILESGLALCSQAFYDVEGHIWSWKDAFTRENRAPRRREGLPGSGFLSAGGAA